eukprot:XP_019923213.1 PREDICTED: sulfotransferase family cytosolic 1B member 1 [Crassostrea gigas]
MDSKTTTNSLPEVLFDGMAIPPFPPLRVSVRQRFEDIRGLCTRPDDVIITTYLKSGSHWVWEIICMLLQGTTSFVKEGKGSQFLEALDDLNLINKMTSPRTLNTHLPYRWLPRKHLENDGKIVHVVRNPKDVAVSMFFHFKETGEFVGSEMLDFDDRVNGMLSNAPNQPYGGWFTYEKDFMKRSKSNIHFVHFERLKRYPLEEIKRLADFLRVSYSDQLIFHIAEKCNFTSLKEADDTTKDTTMCKKNVHGPNSKSIFLDGTIENWKEYFTVSQSERFDDYFCEQMQGCDFKIEFE